MLDSALPQILILLAASVFVVTLARRVGLPAILGYLAVGLLLGPYALSYFAESNLTRLLAELGVVFLLFTLGLEFSWPRMVAMRREVFGLGSLQVLATATVVALVARLFGLDWLLAIVVGGAVALSSTALVVQLLTEKAELNRTHGRIAFSVLLFQDIAFVPFLALAAALGGGSEDFSLSAIVGKVIAGTVAVMVVLAAGRWLLRPLFFEIAHSRLRELFTLAVLFVALASAWASHLAGLSMALGAFLAGMMLAETEYRHQIEAVIRPFRDILLGLFFISVGMLLDLRLLVAEFWLIMAILVALVVVKAAIAAFVFRALVDSGFKALRAGITLAAGGEFSIALLTLLLQNRSLDRVYAQPLLVAIVLSMVVAPILISNNKRIARWLIRDKVPDSTALEREFAVTEQVAQREHVIVCGFGRVGQNLSRVLESQGFEFIAVDLDPARIRVARQAGEPVHYGDSADEEVLEKVGLATASAVIITFANPTTSISILRAVRRSRPNVPVLVRTQDDAKLAELKEAGATEVVPETFEASLMLASHALMLLHMPMSRVLRTVTGLRANRYEMLRDVIVPEGGPREDRKPWREAVRSIVLPPSSWAVGKTIADIRAAGAEVTFTGVRRQGIMGRAPAANMQLREGDIVFIYGTPQALEHAETVLLVG
ncbi:MAG TPA: cation:proton antiporter [Steroidobacteraceae bacterium]|nr:cation:proton antiporter [Steroidobacteraceae bacterium]HRX88918.1 cation:proton antiporter [Steroidobacteraceae bacterium]